MENKEDLVNWMKLCRVKGIGSSKMLKLLSILGGPKNIYDASGDSLFKTRVFSEEMIKEYDIIKTEDTKYFEYIVDECQNKEIKIIPFYSDEYPLKLKPLPDSPLTLFAWGDMSLLKTKKIAIVGSRESSESAKEWAFENSKYLANQKITIVSGGAKGIDISAHKGCLSVGGKTITVLGSGFFRMYPEEHRLIFEEIKDKGLLLSEHPPHDGGTRLSLLRRNRIISGISESMMLVTSSSKGGSFTQLQIAHKQRIPIFCPSLNLNLLPNEGIKEAISQYNAKEITDINQVINEVNKPDLFSYM